VSEEELRLRLAAADVIGLPIATVHILYEQCRWRAFSNMPVHISISSRDILSLLLKFIQFYERKDFD
jgi:hypothetical protein